MTSSDEILRRNVYREFERYFGVKDKEYIESVISSRRNPEAWDFLWKEVERDSGHYGKILDMAAGVGTFVLQGLIKGYDVYGIEPEEWKLEYFRVKVAELGLPEHYKSRVIKGVGEYLPFADNSFDYVVSWQTLEHVQNVEKCISEMIRVLKPGGRLRIWCPDYGSSFYEPHYRLPFPPKVNKNIAKIYLKILGRPTLGLNLINMITKKQLLQYLTKIENVEIIDITESQFRTLVDRIMNKYGLPKLLANLLADLYINRRVYTFKAEKQINLLIVKRGNEYEKNKKNEAE